MVSQTLVGERYFEMTMTSGAFGHFNDTFAGGQEANNKVDADILYLDPERRVQIVEGLANLALPYKPDLLIPMPNGADQWAKELAVELGGLPVCYLEKISSPPGVKNVEFKNPVSQGRVNRSERALLVEDFGNRWTSTRGGLAIPSIMRKAVGLVGIGFRGASEDRRRGPINSRFLWERHIPDMMEDDDPLWGYATPKTE